MSLFCPFYAHLAISLVKASFYIIFVFALWLEVGTVSKVILQGTKLENCIWEHPAGEFSSQGTVAGSPRAASLRSPSIFWFLQEAFNPVDLQYDGIRSFLSYSITMHGEALPETSVVSLKDFREGFFTKANDNSTAYEHIQIAKGKRKTSYLIEELHSLRPRLQSNQ
eukprot:Gb_19895 [translate_table: standard]